jgi:hypothetical protein
MRTAELRAVLSKAPVAPLDDNRSRLLTPQDARFEAYCASGWLGLTSFRITSPYFPHR